MTNPLYMPNLPTRAGFVADRAFEASVRDRSPEREVIWRVEGLQRSLAALLRPH